jgi:mRNA-degrading endonuclease RelE of RelBE toxin-antitoxin system
LLKEAKVAALPDERAGKAVKSIKGTRDEFERLRVGDYRVMFDLLNEDRVVLVLGIINRRDLERWLRRR